jgi:hypothetical protein
MNGYSPKQLVITPITVGASVTALQIGSEFGVSAGGARSIRLDIQASAVTAGGGITVALQHKIFDTWTALSSANASVAISANGRVAIRMFIERSADQADMPLAKNARLVITTGVGSAVTIDKASVLQEL